MLMLFLRPRSISFVPVLALLFLFSCSQNPHVDVASQRTVQASANATPAAPVNGLVPGDRDRDGVPDQEDQCPDLAGPRSNHGCPRGTVKDRDRDGVPDAADHCPDERGPIENNGCPYDRIDDHDGDGVIDTDDRCPATPGPAENEGCPWPAGDRDHDFVPDQEDRCPDTAGQIYNQGCPLELPAAPDSDGDGIPDREDRCPREPGQIFNEGCPLRERDNDGDGIPDARDACPFVPGPAANRGCPYPREEERRVLLEVKESLKFDFDRATLQPQSFPALNRLVAFLHRYPGAQLKMVGHTDDVGTDAYNMALSQARVQTVRSYLVSRGISGARILVLHRGEREPLVSVDELEGRSLEQARALNRRVDMSVRYELPARH